MTQSPGGGPPRAFTSEGAALVSWWSIPVTPDSTRIMARDAEGRVVAYKVAGGDPEPIAGLDAAESPLGWAADGRGVYVASTIATGWSVERLDPSTGRRTPWTEIHPREVAGLRLGMVQMSPDGRSWVHSYPRLLTDLYVAVGLR